MMRSLAAPAALRAPSIGAPPESRYSLPVWALRGTRNKPKARECLREACAGAGAAFPPHVSRPPHAYLRRLRVRMSCSSLVFSRKRLAVLAKDFETQMGLSEDEAISGRCLRLPPTRNWTGADAGFAW